MTIPLLEARHVTKRFSGITALDDISLEVADHEFVAMIGPNGAGKTTFFNCLTGVLTPEQGTVRFGDADLLSMPTYRRARLGLARTFQRIELVAERARTRNGGLLRDLTGRSAPQPEERERCDAVLDLIGLMPLAEYPIESLSLGKGRLVELARALMCQPRLLFLDEPSSGLDIAETHEMATVLETVQREQGTAILLVEHDVPLVERLAGRTYVLDVGRLLAAGPTSEVLADADVRAAYLGQGV